MFNALIEKLKKDPKTIVFTEGPDARILEATARIKKEGFLKVILVGNVAEVEAAAKRAALTSRASRSSIPRPTPAWTRWSRKWWSCGRAR